MESSIVQRENRRFGWPMIGYIKASTGITMLINFIMLMICWCIMADWKVNVEEPCASKLASETSYFLFVTVFPWLLYIVFFITLIRGFDNEIANINWRLRFFMICALWDFLLFVAACVILNQALNSPCNACLCGRLYAASVFGFLTSSGLRYQGHCHYCEYQESIRTDRHPTVAAV